MFDDEEEPGPRFAAKQAAEIIAEPGEEIGPVVNQLRRFVQRGHVLTRGQIGSGRTASNLFAVPDLATARILRTLTSLGLADNAVADAAKIGCYAFGGESPDNPNGHSITDALLAYKGAAPKLNLIFELSLHHDPDDHDRSFHARIFDPEQETRGPSRMATAVIYIPLGNWLPRFSKLLNS